jgi:hypothetical protein
MSRFSAAKKLDALTEEVESLEREQHELEHQALGTEIPDAERRGRYFSIADAEVRRRLIGIEWALQDLRQRHRAAAVEYWTAVSQETRNKLDDLKSESPTSAWRRAIWWDLLTIFWILGGAGWLAFGIPGAAVGAVATAIWARFIVRSRERTRLTSIRQGEDVLRSSENELRQAQQQHAPALSPDLLFTRAEAETGLPDLPGAAMPATAGSTQFTK